MMHWRHKGFVRRMVQRAATRYEPGYEPHVYDMVHEGWTTKRHECGYIKFNIGTAKRYTCPKCKADVERDGSASKTVLIKSTSLKPSPAVQRKSKKSK
jgi:transposase